MRHPIKSFSVEVRRSRGKPSPAVVAKPVAPEPIPTEPSPQPEGVAASVAPPRRILESLPPPAEPEIEAPAPARARRPRAEPAGKPGRPRKREVVAAAPVAPAPPPVIRAPVILAPVMLAPIAAGPLSSRRADPEDFKRGDRWKRRLPKVLR